MCAKNTEKQCTRNARLAVVYARNVSAAMHSLLRFFADVFEFLVIFVFRQTHQCVMCSPPSDEDLVYFVDITISSASFSATTHEADR